MPRRARRLIIPAIIVVFWAAMMGVLVQREVLVPRAVPGSGTPGEFDSWMGIYIDSPDGPDKQIGFVHTESTRDSRDGVDGNRYAMTVKLAVTMLNAPTEVIITGSAWNPDFGGLSEFDFRIRSFQHSMRVKGAVDDGRLNLEIGTGGSTYPLSFPVGRDLFLSGSMGATTLNLPQLKVGEEVLVDAFDPMTFSTGKARIKCIAEERLRIHDEWIDTKVMLAILGGATTKVWITDEEETIRIETPYGFVIQKTTQDAALTTLDDTGAEEFLNALAVRPTGKRPFRGAERMEFRVSNVPQGSRPPSDTIQQELEPGRYLIQRVEYEGVDDGGAVDREHLEGDPFIQVDHPDIVALAGELTADSETQWEKARAIYDWVYEEIEKVIVLSFPSAIDVLQTRQGDCNEHAVLYAALARSAGVPTRIAVGIVWSDALNGFYYHSWPEVYVGRWIAMDPTLGQVIADATHVKLLTGNIEKWPQLVPYLGQLQIEVLDVE